MTLLFSESRIPSIMAEESVLEDHLDELRETNARLRLLVCELLDKNQQLRFRCGYREPQSSPDSSAQLMARSRTDVAVYDQVIESYRVAGLLTPLAV
jgi:hypothetical protein